MPFESVKLFRKIVLDLDTSGAVTLEVFTEQPGSASLLRATYTVNTESSTTGRLPVKLILPSETKGRYLRLKLSGSATVRLFGARVYYREIGQNTLSVWRWASVPVEITPDLFSPARLPIPPTPDEFAAVKMPIEPTPDEFSAVRVPGIPPTPDEFAAVEIPMPRSDYIPKWFDLPLDRVA